MMMMTMYKKLLPLVNRFVYLRQGYFNRFYEGKLLEITPDTLTLQAYDEHGKMDSQWVIALPTITEFMTGDRDLDELNMKVSMAKTIEQAEFAEIDKLSQHRFDHPTSATQPSVSVTGYSGVQQATLFSASAVQQSDILGTTIPSHSVSFSSSVSSNQTLPVAVKPTALYGHFPESLRSTAVYLEETLGFTAYHQSSASINPADEEQHPTL
jgi:hypothetical protein